jgi:hypothetical protein
MIRKTFSKIIDILFVFRTTRGLRLKRITLAKAYINMVGSRNVLGPHICLCAYNIF